MKIIQARPGKNTSDRLLDLLRQNPKGLSPVRLSKILNRPVSMINICLKILLTSNKVFKSEDNFYFLNRPSKG